MGLDIRCNGFESVRVGSYSTVHLIRKDWINAYIGYLKSIKADEDLIAKLEKTITREDRIDYRLFEGLYTTIEKGFDGLYTFVNHSDCDGIWTHEEIGYILETLHLIRIHLKENTFTWHFLQDGRYYLEDLFEYSIQNQQDVILC